MPEARGAKSLETPAEALLGSVRWGRFTIWLIAGVLLMCTVLICLHLIEQFLIKDRRFRLADADTVEDVTRDSSAAGQMGRPFVNPNLVLEGTHYASSSQIRHQFREDFGRSLYLVPISRRREQLLAMDWVEEAKVTKVWPQTVKVSIRERVPVAFIHLPPHTADGPWRYALIDRDGFILRPRVPAQFTLPVISGIREEEPIEDRHARIGRVLAMLREIGPLSQNISETDAHDPNNLIVAEQAEGTVVNLMLGSENYSERLGAFLANFHEIHEKRPDVKTLDLRVDGTITAVGMKPTTAVGSGGGSSAKRRGSYGR